MISTYLDVQPRSRIIENLLEFLPKPGQLDIKDFNGQLGVESVILIYDGDIMNYHLKHNDHVENMIVHSWERMYHDIIKHIATIFMGRDEYYAVKMTPIILDGYDDAFHGYEIRLRIMASINVAETRNVTIAEWSYHPITNHVVEWRCGSCDTPNVPNERWCTQCGAPRALLMQEMMCVSCGMPRDNGNSCSQCGSKYIDLYKPN